MTVLYHQNQSYQTNRLAGTFVGFKNYTRHLTRSRYVSFQIDSQKQMVKLLLDFSQGRAVDDGTYPDSLFNKLIEYGYLKSYQELSWWQRIKIKLNLLNENRKKLFFYKGAPYVITSFVFMAFYCKKAGNYLCEKAILPGWRKRLSRLIFSISTDIDSAESVFLIASKNQQKKLIKYGIVAKKDSAFCPDSVFFTKCQFSPELLQEIPQDYRKSWEGKDSLPLDKVKLNEKVYIANLSDLPDHIRSQVFDVEWAKRVRANLWIEDPITGMLMMFHVSESVASIIRCLYDRTITYGELDPDIQALLSCSYVCYSDEQLSQERKYWDATLERARNELSKEGNLVIVKEIIPPIMLAVLRCYVDELDRNSYLIPDKANGKIKNRYWLHREPIVFHIQLQLAKVFNLILNTPIKVGHNALSLYKKGANLPIHRDDVLAFTWVASLPIKSTPYRDRIHAWPFCVNDNQNKQQDLMLGDGDVGLINPQLEHWRDELKDHQLSIFFMWFVEHDYIGYVNGNWID